MLYNLLEDPILRVDKAGGSRHLVTLPEAYSALMADEVVAFPAVRAHHRHAWHAFLVQVGTMATYEAGLRQPPRRAGAWLHILRGLTPDYSGDEPWHLAVEDPTVPAFMQPPATTPAGLADYSPDEIVSPDEIDLVITSKNHETKQQVAVDAEVDDWVVTLVALQTMEGFRGSRNYGISRMKAGFASRPAFSLAPDSPRPGTHVRRDITALLEARPTLLKNYPMVDGGIRLMWTEPWGGQFGESLYLPDLDPLYVDVCRRIRLRLNPSDRAIRAVKAGTLDYRVSMGERTDPPKDKKRVRTGLTGDPWTPFKTGEKAGALTLTETGFTYRMVASCLTDWEHPPLLQPTQSELDSAPPMRLVARAMARGRGVSSGYHERSIPLSHQAVTDLAAGVPAGGALGEIARGRVHLVAAVQRILNQAVWVFRTSGQSQKPATASTRIDRLRPWRLALDRQVDTNFFDGLQDELAAAVDTRREIRRQWLLAVVDEARQVLNATLDSMSCTAGRRLWSMNQAASFFETKIRTDEDLKLLHNSRPPNENGHRDGSDQPVGKEADVNTEERVDSTPEENPPRRRQLADAAVSIAGELAVERYPRGDLARLRRMDPDKPGPSAFWDLLAKRELAFGQDMEARWALIVHGIALMTPLNREGEEFRTAHDGYMPVGRALFAGGDPARKAALYSEARLNRLLRADGPRIRSHIAHVCRLMRSANVRFNWRELASFILSEGRAEDAAAEARRRILREYHRAQWVAKRANEEQEQQEV